MTRNDQIGISYGRVDEIPEGILHKLIVLFEYTDNGSAPFCCVPLDSPAQPNVIYIIFALPSQFIKILYVIMLRMRSSWKAISPSNKMMLAGLI